MTPWEPVRREAWGSGSRVGAAAHGVNAGLNSSGPWVTIGARPPFWDGSGFHLGADGGAWLLRRRLFRAIVRGRGFPASAPGLWLGRRQTMALVINDN